MSAEKNVHNLLNELKKLPNVTILLSEETISEKLLKAGIHTDRLLSFLKRQTQHQKEILEVKKDTMDDEDFLREKLELHEADIFISYLENSLNP